MTTVEALACGTAVIAANRGGLGELAAGAALTVDDPTADNLAEAIEQVSYATVFARGLAVPSTSKGKTIPAGTR